MKWRKTIIQELVMKIVRRTSYMHQYMIAVRRMIFLKIFVVFIKKLKSISQLDHYELNNFKNSHETNEKDECNSTENLHSKEDCNKSCNKTKQTTLLEKYYNLRREHRINMLGEWSINNANNIDNTSPPSLFDSTDSDVWVSLMLFV